MKKLVFMLGVAAVACGVQAATFEWATNSKAWGIASSDLSTGLEKDKTYNVGSANADTMSNQIGSNAATWMYTLILTDAADTSKTDTLSGSLTSGSFSSRKVAVDLSSDLVVAGKDLTYSLVFTGNVTDGKSAAWDVTSNTITGSWHVNDTGDLALGTAAASSWSTPAGTTPTPPDPSGVPEPTSGLLLLVGGAMIALRRKQK